VREQLAQGCYLLVYQGRVEPATSWSPVQHATVTPDITVATNLYKPTSVSEWFLNDITVAQEMRFHIMGIVASNKVKTITSQGS